MTQPDLFSEPRYPDAPGYRRTRTSRDAADAIKPRAQTLRDRVLSLLKTEALTPDETAERLGETVLAIRPRFSEAYKLGLIVKLPITRMNASGLQAHVWRAA